MEPYFALTCRALMLFGCPTFVAFLMPLWYIRQLLFWFLSVQLRTDVQRLCVTCRALMLFG